MEKELKEGLNFILGAVSLIKEEIDNGFPKFQQTFQELAAKGAEDNSELSVNLRKYTQEGIQFIQNLIPQKQ